MLTTLEGQPVNAQGEQLPPYHPPLPDPQAAQDGSWDPFGGHIEFDFAYLTFKEAKLSERLTNAFLKLWAATLLKNGNGQSPWGNAKALGATIDKIQQGPCPWKTYTVRYKGPLPPNPPKWMTDEFNLCCQDSRILLHEQHQTMAFKEKFHISPYQQFNSEGERVFSNVMSADWAWSQAGAMFIPIVAGSDKTTVSVATGHQVFHPVYMSPGTITNIARRAHGNGILPVGFLPIPKVSKNEAKSDEFAIFSRQVYHACLARIFQPLKAGITKPELIRCPDGHLWRAFYGLGPYIADYLKQVYLAGVVSGWCPKCDAPSHDLDSKDALRRSHAKTDVLMAIFDEDVLWDDYGIQCDYQPFNYDFPPADIHELLTPDLLHQVIKGTFKDHIVTWARADVIQEDIDPVPVYPGLRRFPEGRNFEQWTGNDSKALMKVYLACIVNYVPSRMIQCLAAFLDFCYIARQNSLSGSDLIKLDDVLRQFHENRQVFIDAGVRDDISLPRQHSLVHYSWMIRLFGSPNGLCSSIMESKHIVAVKKPWRCSSRTDPLPQMLRRVTREEKLEAVCRHFSKQGMMAGDTLSYTTMELAGELPDPEGQNQGNEEDGGDLELGPVEGPKVLSSIKLSVTPARGYPRHLGPLAVHIGQPLFPAALRRFLWSELHPDSPLQAHTILVDECPTFSGSIQVHHSAVAYFYAPSDVCGAGGMYHKRIRSTPLWHNSYERRDTVFVKTDPNQTGMMGMSIGRVFLFFSFTFLEKNYSWTFVHWLERESDQSMAVISLDCIPRGAHLLPVYGPTPLPSTFYFSQTLDVFRAYFVNRYIDHHCHEFLE
ncbi:hypothetical protein CPB83DRAFT_870662 [Crepidotus variabilis]|uniref:Uncharacterized protein n=1 Tax=Crepidotus variabilis TaxID=179855 RepID=A0A9P6EBQ1_9AGAR|nr:hypothetical protein CPB83DRAFT_870662 [Crepidotus variabilis]